MEEELVALLDKLRYGKSARERNQALKDLKRLEAEGGIREDDLLELIEDKDYVFQAYAIGALGRLKVEDAAPRLCELFENSSDPLVLPLLLDTFTRIGSDHFSSCVENKLQQLEKVKKENPKGDHSFILEHIIVPSLKYFQVSTDKTVRKTVRQYLESPDPMVRWNALITFDKLDLEISREAIESIHKNDSYVLVREQAAIMLEKRNRKSNL